MIINQLIDKRIPFLTDDQTVHDALKVFVDSSLSQLPITRSGQYLGIINKGDLKLIMEEQDIPSEMRYYKGIYVSPYDNLLEALRIGHLYQLELVPIVDSNLKYIGSVKMGSCLRFLIGNTTLGEVGGILVLKAKKNDYSLSEISRIIELEGSNLLHFFINDYNETTQELKITIKIDSLNLESLERTFERYGYFVDAVFSEKEEMNGIKERYDSLMKYLNV